jgi:anti-anti-sigma factor
VTTIPRQSRSAFLSTLAAPVPQLAVNLHLEGDRCVVHVTGELDLATRDQLFIASTAGNHPAMVIDLAGVTFMDCSGFGALVACRRVINSREGATLTIRGLTGQPARLFGLIAELEKKSPNP